jgi:formylglycine-generating enzyme required for sulfatase activity
MLENLLRSGRELEDEIPRSFLLERLSDLPEKSDLLNALLSNDAQSLTKALDNNRQALFDYRLSELNRLIKQAKDSEAAGFFSDALNYARQARDLALPDLRAMGSLFVTFVTSRQRFHANMTIGDLRDFVSDLEARVLEEGKKRRQQDLAESYLELALDELGNRNYQKVCNYIDKIRNDCPLSDFAIQMVDGSFLLDGRSLLELRALVPELSEQERELERERKPDRQTESVRTPATDTDDSFVSADDGPPGWLVGPSTVKPLLQTVPQPVQQVVAVSQTQQTASVAVSPSDPAASGFAEVLSLIRQARNLEASDVITASAKAVTANEKLSALMLKHNADSPLIQDLIHDKTVLDGQTDAQFQAWREDLQQRAARFEELQRQERTREQARREREAERQRQESLAVKAYSEAYIAMRNGNYRKALELISAIESDYPLSGHAARLKDGSFRLYGKSMEEIKVLAPEHGQQHTFDGIEFVFIGPGEFNMGESYDARRVKISNGFWMGKYELTQGQWQAIMGNNPSHFKSGDNYPVENVSWDDHAEFGVQTFIKKLNKKVCGKEFDSEQVWRANLKEGNKDADGCYRLPTEAEWEYAARAGTSTKYSWGDNATCDKANYGNANWPNECKDSNPGQTSAVGKYPANKWGLHDMHGNVEEWVLDNYGNYEKCDAGVCIDPVNFTTKGLSRVYRGGSWGNGAGYLRSAYRNWVGPGKRNYSLGFRLVCPVRR